MCQHHCSTVVSNTKDVNAVHSMDDDAYVRLFGLLELARTRHEQHDIPASSGPTRSGHEPPIGRDAWDKHAALVDEEMRAYESSGTCPHHWDYDITHHEPGDVSKFTRALVYLDFYTKGCATEQLKDLDVYFGLLEAATITVVKASAHLKTTKANYEHERLQNGRYAGAGTEKDGTSRKEKFGQDYTEAELRLQDEERAMAVILTGFAYKLLFAGVDMWNFKPKCVHDQSLQQGFDVANTALHSANLSLERRDDDIQALTLELQGAKNKTTEVERMLKASKRDVEKSYYEDVQKRVESRVADVRLEFSTRLNAVEGKALQYDKMKEDYSNVISPVVQPTHNSSRFFS